MITTKVIYDYLVGIRTELYNQNIPILDEIKYDPNTTFDSALRKILVDSDVAFKTAENVDNIVGMLWSREPIQKNTVLGRQFSAYINNVPPEYTSDEYKAMLVELPVTIALISSSADLLEEIEEYFLTSEMYKKLTVNISPTIGDIEVSIKDFSVTSLTAEDMNTYGSIMAISITSTLNYPLFRLKAEDVKVIKEINLNIYDGIYVNRDSILLASTKIEEEL